MTTVQILGKLKIKKPLGSSDGIAFPASVMNVLMTYVRYWPGPNSTNDGFAESPKTAMGRLLPVTCRLAPTASSLKLSASCDFKGHLQARRNYRGKLGVPVEAPFTADARQLINHCAV